MVHIFRPSNIVMIIKNILEVTCSFWVDFSHEIVILRFWVVQFLIHLWMSRNLMKREWRKKNQWRNWPNLQETSSLKKQAGRSYRWFPDDLEGWNGGWEEAQMRGDVCMYTWLIQNVVQQKLTHCKIIIFQLKNWSYKYTTINTKFKPRRYHQKF